MTDRSDEKQVDVGRLLAPLLFVVGVAIVVTFGPGVIYHIDEIGAPQREKAKTTRAIMEEHAQRSDLHRLVFSVYLDCLDGWFSPSATECLNGALDMAERAGHSSEEAWAVVQDLNDEADARLAQDKEPK